jgi:MarR family transcriptional regulator, transcriptional regulator for hemolysin
MDENFAFEVGETARVLRREFDRRAAVLGVTRAQWRVLARLRRRDGLRQVELADLLDVEPITLCRMVDRLEEAGLVERRRDETDRRAWLVHLTPKAEPLVEELRALGDIFMGDALAGISKTDRETAQAVLAKVRDNLSRSGTGAARKVS